MSDQITLELLTSDLIAETKVNEFCVKRKLNIPFTLRYHSSSYAKSTDVYDLISQHRSFPSQRSYYRELYLDLGSKCFKDESTRSFIIKDHRYLNTWIHNPRSVAMILLCYQPLFNNFVGKGKLSPKYSHSYFQELLAETEFPKLKLAA